MVQRLVARAAGMIADGAAAFLGRQQRDEVRVRRLVTAAQGGFDEPATVGGSSGIVTVGVLAAAGGERVLAVVAAASGA